MEDQEFQHSMTYKEREQLKKFARQGLCLDQALIMISHWMGCGHDVTFSGYASNWAVAQAHEDVQAIRDQWPLNEPRMIADGRTEWGSAIKS